MPQVIELPARTIPYTELPRIKWTAGQYEAIIAARLLPKTRYELLEGDIVESEAIPNSASLTVSLLFAFFGPWLGFHVLLARFTLAIDDNNLPEPDFAVLTTPNPTLSERGYIQPNDVRLVVEVSDATLPRDLTSKARLYANANIPEYWVIDIAGRRLLIHQTPGADGYALVTQYEETESASPAFAPHATFTVSDILP